jgi:hypothetical protein
MCFSSVASFTSACVLWIIGFAGLWLNFYCDHYLTSWNLSSNEKILEQILMESKYWWPVLFTPIFFGIQQFCEGFVWIYLKQDESAQVPGVCFSFFAYDHLSGSFSPSSDFIGFAFGQSGFHLFV